MVSKRRFSVAAGLAVAALAAAWLSSSCATYSRDCLRAAPPAPPAVGQVQVTFLGVGGFLLRYQTPSGGVALMTAPLYSNPTFAEIATQPVATDQRLVEALLRPRLPRNADEVLGILSGHAHYDHLMDVPYVALRLTPKAEVYGNDAMTRLLDPLRPRLGGRRLVSLEQKAKDLEARRCWTDAECPNGLPDGHEPVGDYIRIWPILSEHSAQFRIRIPFVPKALLPPLHLWRGDLLEPRAALPERPGEWVEGTTLAYVIDFLDRPGGTVAFRVYYQDSGTREPFGFPPACLLKERRVDLALLCVGGSETVARHPAAILKGIDPTYAIGAHWEDFLNPRTLPLPDVACGPKNPCCERVVGLPKGKPQSFMKQVKASLRAGGFYSLPCPDTSTTFRPLAGGGWRIDSTATTAGWEAKR